MRGHLIAALLAAAAPVAALAQIVVHSEQGEVLANGAPIFHGQPLLPEAAIVTGAASHLVLRFSDGMEVAVNENSRFRVVDYRYAKGPNDRVVLDLLQGAARVSTGDVARRNPKQFFFRTQQAQFGVQGPADFSVVLVNPAFLTVNAGTVTASNGAGTVAFGTGATATVASSGALATPLAASSFPSAASGALGNLQAAGLAAPSGAASGAVAATGVAGTGIAVPALAVGAGVAAAAAAADKDEAAAATTHH